MPQVVDITSAAGTPLPVASPHHKPQSALREKVEVVEVSSHLSGWLVEGTNLPSLQLRHLLRQRGVLDAPRYPKLLIDALSLTYLLL
jgi:hypothetical protein